MSTLGLGKHQKKAEAKGVLHPISVQLDERVKTLREYKWSSFPFYIGGKKAVPVWLERSEILMRLPEKHPFEFYRGLAVQRISNEFDSNVLEKLSGRLAIGSSSFMEETRKLAGDIDRNIDCKHELKNRVSWKRLIQVAEEIRSEPWDVFRFRRGDIGKAVVFRLARQYCGMTLREVGEKVGGVDYAAVSDLIRRYEKRDKTDPLERKMVEILNLET